MNRRRPDKTRVDVLIHRGQDEWIPGHLYDYAGSGFWVEDREDSTLVRCYPDDVQTFLHELYASDLQIIEVTTEEEPQQDYSALTRKYFRPIRLGDLVIRSPWNATKGGRREIIIDPGMAFGTGRHESTRIMVNLMNRTDIGGKQVIDVGCGSAILALYARLLGAQGIVAVDNDLDAVLNAKNNITLNDAVNIEIVCSDLGHIRGSYDTVLANLDINILTRQSREVAGLAKPGGYVIVSGIVGRDSRLVPPLFPDCRVIDTDKKKSWRGFVFQRIESEN